MIISQDERAWIRDQGELVLKTVYHYFCAKIPDQKWSVNSLLWLPLLWLKYNRGNHYLSGPSAFSTVFTIKGGHQIRALCAQNLHNPPRAKQQVGLGVRFKKKTEFSLPLFNWFPADFTTFKKT